MANQEHLELLKQGVEQWNKWREQHSEIQPDLSGANLRNADLCSVDLKNAILIDADLSSANLMGADLSYTNLNRTYLNHTNLHGANLSGACLIGARLSHANLSGVNLNGTDLSNSYLGDTILAAVDLHETKGLAAIQHYGPSHIDLHTLQLPQDGSALHFLRGAGVSDEWINLYRAQMMHPIQYHSCLLSYSSKDEMLVQRLHADLQDRGVRCWFAPEDMKIGDKLRARIDEAIHVHEKLLLLLSEHAIKSDWVEDEVEAALEKEKRQQREVLFPVRLDDAVMQTAQAWAAKLRRTRHIGDFTNWTNPQAYQQAFERLLRDLKRAD